MSMYVHVNEQVLCIAMHGAVYFHMLVSVLCLYVYM